MVTKYILDTHALIWHLQADKRLGSKAREIIANPEIQIVLPIMVLVEATLVIERGRANIPNFATLWNDVYADKRITIHDLTLAIFWRSLTPEGLKIPELHDRLIVSTGLHLQDMGHQVAILTADLKITEAGVLSVIW